MEMLTGVQLTTKKWEVATYGSCIATFTDGTKRLLVTLDERLSFKQFIESFNKLYQSERRRLEQKIGSRRLRTDNDDKSSSNESPMKISNEIHHTNVKTKTVMIEVHEDVVHLVSSVNGVTIVEEDGPTWIAGVGAPPSVGSQSTWNEKARLWGLDRIDQDTGMDNSYYWDNAAEDIDMYIIDSGVYPDHEDFYGRVERGRDLYTVPGVFDGNNDCNGHGTHVASIAAGKVFGIAKKARIIPLKAVGCDGRGTISALIKALQVASELAESRGRKGVVNISLSAGYTVALNSAVCDAV